MSALPEQILEHALNLLYGTSPGDDLSYRIVMRWKAGETGTPLAIPRAVRLPHLVAVALVLLAITLGLWLPSRSEAPVLIVLEDTVQILRGSTWSPVAEHEIRLGDTVFLAGSSLDLELDGTSMLLEPDALVTFEETGLRVRLGAVQIDHGGDKPFEITTSLMTVRLYDPARLIMQINPRDRGANMSLPTIARQIYLHAAPTALVLSLTLVQGTAQVESGDVTVELRPGELLERAWIEEQDPAGTKVTPVPVSDPAADNAALAFIMKEVGTWDVELNSYDPISGEEMTVKGVEVSKPGPGGAWLITELKFSLPSWENSMLWILGVDENDPTKYIGTSVEANGRMRILEGTFDGTKRILYGRLPSESEVEPTLRMVYSWVSDDERVVVSQQKDGEEWVTGYEFRYRRRKN